jgi:hypothetical protein
VCPAHELDAHQGGLRAHHTSHHLYVVAHVLF